MEYEIMKHYMNTLKEGQTYWDRKNKEQVEYRYLGQTGIAIVCEPGDSGGGMQSCWGVNPADLETIVEKG